MWIRLLCSYGRSRVIKSRTLALFLHFFSVEWKMVSSNQGWHGVFSPLWGLCEHYLGWMTRPVGKKWGSLVAQGNYWDEVTSFWVYHKQQNYPRGGFNEGGFQFSKDSRPATKRSWRKRFLSSFKIGIFSFLALVTCIIWRVRVGKFSGFHIRPCSLKMTHFFWWNNTDSSIQYFGS